MNFHNSIYQQDEIVIQRLKINYLAAWLFSTEVIVNN